MKTGISAVTSLRLLFMTAMILAVSTAAARAELRIDITRGNIDPMPVAITDFYSADTQTAAVGRELTEVISADLERSGLFAPINKRAFIQSNESLLVRPRFSDWRVINAQALVSGSAEIASDGQLSVKFRLWDVFGELQLTGSSLASQPRLPDGWTIVSLRASNM